MLQRAFHFSANVGLFSFYCSRYYSFLSLSLISYSHLLRVLFSGKDVSSLCPMAPLKYLTDMKAAAVRLRSFRYARALLQGLILCQRLRQEIPEMIKNGQIRLAVGRIEEAEKAWRMLAEDRLR